MSKIYVLARLVPFLVVEDQWLYVTLPRLDVDRLARIFPVIRFVDRVEKIRKWHTDSRNDVFFQFLKDVSQKKISLLLFGHNVHSSLNFWFLSTWSSIMLMNCIIFHCNTRRHIYWEIDIWVICVLELCLMKMTYHHSPSSSSRVPSWHDLYIHEFQQNKPISKHNFYLLSACRLSPCCLGSNWGNIYHSKKNERLYFYPDTIITLISTPLGA